jgi:hypothetical protein
VLQTWLEAVQFWQLLPPVPHWVLLSPLKGTQVPVGPPAQQPLEQLVELHAGPLTQVPLVTSQLAEVSVQLEQAAPPRPQAELLSVMQVPPWQHPPEQLLGVHVPP